MNPIRAAQYIEPGRWSPGNFFARSGETRRETDAQRRQKTLLDIRVERSENAIEFTLVDGMDGQGAGQEYGILFTDAERHAVQLAITTKEMFEERSVILLGCWHHVCLEMQRPLTECEPDRVHVLRFTLDPSEPTNTALINAFDSSDGGASCVL